MPRKAKTKLKESITGKYVYDAKTDRIVKVSDRIPSVSGRRSKSSPCGEGACPPRGGGCGNGPCGMS
ncbi:MAG: hypothetical protein HY928_08095 [Elusimicrobia bacterium]|nr:hypothetical protein [Elusimicrobiota bacterium]